MPVESDDLLEKQVVVGRKVFEGHAPSKSSRRIAEKPVFMSRRQVALAHTAHVGASIH